LTNRECSRRNGRVRRFNLEKHPMQEAVCTGKNVNFFGKVALRMPIADKPDF
jgi:hypothetical protein